MLAYTIYESDNRVRRYAESLVKSGDQVDVIAHSGRKISLREEEINGVRVNRIQCRVNTERRGCGTYLMPALSLRPPERRELGGMSRSQGGRADEVRRARIILGLTGGQTLAGVSRSQSFIIPSNSSIPFSSRTNLRSLGTPSGQGRSSGH